MRNWSASSFSIIVATFQEPLDALITVTKKHERISIGEPSLETRWSL
jgi:hypothetical protein